MNQKGFSPILIIIISLIVGVGLAHSPFFADAKVIQFSQILRRGSSGLQVRSLQEFLKTMPDVYPEGLVSGYFGTLTEKAVKRFQGKYGIEQVGVVGPKTRTKLNSLTSLQIFRQQPKQQDFPVRDQLKISMPAPCMSNSNPELVADITDFLLIKRITAPGSPSSEGPKGHSFIWTGGQRVPLYVPADAILESSSYGPQDGITHYSFTFRVKGNCSIVFRFGHITEPIKSILNVLHPSSQQVGTQSVPVATQLSFPAGSLIGYTIGNAASGNWDFGLYNLDKEGALAQHGSYGMHKYAICWVDFIHPRNNDNTVHCLKAQHYSVLKKLNQSDWKQQNKKLRRPF